jgi:hypothetical protein
MNAFLARVGDRINPIVVKETRQAVNSRLVAGFLLLFLGVQLVVMLVAIASRDWSNLDEVNLRAGRELFTFVQGILLGTCLVLIPTMAGVRLAAERSDVNVDLLFISSLTPRAVLSGKLFAAAALALLIFSACAPFMTFAYVMRGLDVPTIFVVLAADYLAVLLATAFSLFLASVPANRGLRILLGLFGLLGMCYLGAGLLGLSSAFLRFGGRYDLTSWEFWAGFAAVALLTLGGIGLLFVWSVALISPPAANRAYIVRVYTLGFWAAVAGGCCVWSLYLGRPEPITVWGLIGCLLFSLQMVVAVCERDHWGARVARRIPRNPVLWVPAFLLYSGAAGGIVFGVIGSIFTVIGLVAWYTVVPPPTRYSFEDKPAVVAALVAAYTYCYCLTAALLRRLMADTQFRPGYTWLAVGILFGLGCTVPYIIRFALFERRSRYGYPDELMFLYLPNPVVMIDDAVRDWNSHVGLTVVFLTGWGMLVTALNASWFVKQGLRFRRPRAEKGADA